MRIFLVPISTRRTLLYCQRLNNQLSKNTSILDKVTHKAAETWAKFEASDTKWKRSLVRWGDSVLQRIPYQEWGLKSVPPLSARREASELKGNEKVDLLFPANVIRKENALELVRKLATSRQSLHRKRMWWSLIGAPLTAPIALIPIIPNIPFFYLAYRGWSHWRALHGSKHLEFLLNHNLLKPTPFPAMERLYEGRPIHDDQNAKIEEAGDDRGQPSTGSRQGIQHDRLLLRKSDGAELAKALNDPGIAAEVDRAVTQVRQKLRSESELADEKEHIGTNESKKNDTR